MGVSFLEEALVPVCGVEGVACFEGLEALFQAFYLVGWGLFWWWRFSESWAWFCYALARYIVVALSV